MTSAVESAALQAIRTACYYILILVQILLVSGWPPRIVSDARGRRENPGWEFHGG